MLRAVQGRELSTYKNYSQPFEMTLGAEGELIVVQTRYGALICK